MDSEESYQKCILESKILDLLTVSDPTMSTVFLKIITYYNDNIQKLSTKCVDSYES